MYNIMCQTSKASWKKKQHGPRKTLVSIHMHERFESNASITLRNTVGR